MIGVGGADKMKIKRLGDDWASGRVREEKSGMQRVKGWEEGKKKKLGDREEEEGVVKKRR